ncbi:ATP-dependent DNA ligase [Aeromicrobium sp. S22]|uniref:ATP-dependent DNA ligase n=1 Tax=Aeromicrobium sp. S22 TaxID=2662029 RepID=UPI00129D924F|nr:ATP-dependent DNA ligase [Aeromicrobium sp. S22]MRK02462.1 ATP-dependent DNA ligase [Aeromicrobium sp. S22]
MHAQEVEFSVLPYPQEPMLARPVHDLPDVEDLPGGAVFEPKFDGYRGLIFVQDGHCRIQSRTGRDVTRAFPDIAAAAIDSLPSGVVLDGELVVWGDSTCDFSELQRRLDGDVPDGRMGAHPASFIAFDVLAGAGMDMRNSPLRVRRQALTILLGDVPAPLHVVPQTRDRVEADQWMANYAEANVGVEGVVAKGLSTTYAGGDRGWLKLRIQDSVEGVVVAISGSLRAPRRLVLGLPGPDGTAELVGCTTELTLPQSRRMGAHLARAADDHPWSAGLASTDVPGWPADSPADLLLVDPSTVVEVAADSLETGPWTGAHELVRVRPELQATEVDVIR